MPEVARARLNQIKRETLKTGHAWALKGSWRDLGSSRSPGWAKRVGQRWYHGATHRRLPAMIEAAQLLARHVPNGVTSFSPVPWRKGCMPRWARDQNGPMEPPLVPILRSPSISIAAVFTCIRSR